MRLRSEFIEVQCFSSNNVVIYQDVYGKIKKVSKTLPSNDKSWNVLMIGMDNMSRNRAHYELPKSVNYFRKSGWLDFKAYNKASAIFTLSFCNLNSMMTYFCLLLQIGDSTLPNVMAIVTNKNVSSLFHECSPDMMSCNDAIIWSRYKEAGYVTAYGEDWSESYYSNTEHNIMRFRKPPTDHYLRTLFLARERKVETSTCLGKMLSIRHVFSYAFDFVNTYKFDKYFGYFWLSTVSHDPHQSPSTFDSAIRGYFDKLELSGILKNTFVMVFSDHGIRYGSYRNSLESFYETRLPMLFMRVPRRFKTQHPEKYANLVLQQNGLVVPFDLHFTLWDLAANFKPTHPGPHHDGCQQCTSLFNKLDLNRTCEDAGVPDSWCACRALKAVSIDKDYSAYHSLKLVLLTLHNITQNIKTKPFTYCHELSLSKLLRVHTFTEDFRVFYVIAGTFAPDETGFEATVSKDTMLNGEYEKKYGTFQYRLESLEIITSYERPVQCVLERVDKTWCVCGDTLHKFMTPERKKVKHQSFDKIRDLLKGKI